MSISPYDAWVLRCLISGQPVSGELTQVGEQFLGRVDPKTGKTVWQQARPALQPESDYAGQQLQHGFATATPIIEQDRVYVVGAYGYVHCLDVKTGAVIWEKHIGRDYAVEEMSCRPSPLIEGSLLIVFTGAKPGASVLALDKLTGKEVWKALDDHVSNSSPIAITSAGRRPWSYSP